MTDVVDLEALEDRPPLLFELLEFGKRWEMSIGPPRAEVDLIPVFAFVGVDDLRPLGGLELGCRALPVIIVGMMTAALSRPGIITISGRIIVALMTAAPSRLPLAPPPPVPPPPPALPTGGTGPASRPLETIGGLTG